MVVGVEVGQKDEAACPKHCEEYANTRQRGLCAGCIGCKAAVVSEPALGCEAQVEEDGGNYGTGDEERFQSEGPDVGDVCDLLVVGHRGIVWRAFSLPGSEHGTDHAEPHAC